MAPITGALAVAGLIPPLAVFVAVAAAVLALLIGILHLAGAMGMGGGMLEAACLPSPMVRLIKDDENAACDFDTRQGAVEDALNRLNAIRAMAARDLPVGVWYDASVFVTGGGDLAELLAFLDQVPLAPPPPAAGKAWLPWAAGAAVLVGGALVVKKLRS
jgi:hypothetical protein